MTKREKKKRQIADSAILALQELGYANTTLRDIAKKSELSLGMLHYYFEDRTELIIFCVQVYKEKFIEKIIAAINNAKDAAHVGEALAGALAASIVNDALTHRLWYDIRSQAMFNEAFKPTVSEIERALIAVLRQALLVSGNDKKSDPEICYAVLDGLFHYQIENQSKGQSLSKEELSVRFQTLLSKFL